MFYTFAEKQRHYDKQRMENQKSAPELGRAPPKKETLLKDIWTIEYKLNQIKEELLRYGVDRKYQEMGSGETNMGKSDDLDNCFACSNNIDIHEL